MTEVGDLIDFDIIEGQKENIQSLPSGRSAKSLFQIYSPKEGITSPSQTQDINTNTRQGFENEIANIEDADDPLDIYDRYVKWALNAYPSASASSESQLLPLLERATKTFTKHEHYRNDPRYLKIWLHYIRLFSDAPREVYSYLARHKIGDRLALFYEEFAAWLESAGRWNQAEEVYNMGIEIEARPMERLTRKFGEFESRRAKNKPDHLQEPSSPALPTVRPALAAKAEPFSGTTPESVNPQANSRYAAQPSKGRKPKMQIFSDEDEDGKAISEANVNGWDSIGSMVERKKENTKEARPWNGEKLDSVTKQNTGMSKMAVFKDQSTLSKPNQMLRSSHSASDRGTVNPKTGKRERVFVNLEAVYPNAEDIREEYCFEELRARSRGWLQRSWRDESLKVEANRKSPRSKQNSESTTTLIPIKGSEEDDFKNDPQQTMNLNDENCPSVHEPDRSKIERRARREERTNRTRKIKVQEVKYETQTVQTNLDSPQGPRFKKKRSAEPTMTTITKAATDEVYELFNAPMESKVGSDEETDSDDESEDDYTSAGESTGTGRISATTSDDGEETERDLTEERSEVAEDETTETDTGWSDFTKRKHMPQSENESHESTAEIENDEEAPAMDHGHDTEGYDEEIATPTSPTSQAQSSLQQYVPVPPDGYYVPTGPYRHASEIAANRAPFMTPIVEKTESSVGALTAAKEKDYFSARTPCPKGPLKTPTSSRIEEDVGSSPFEDALEEALEKTRLSNSTSPRDAVGQVKTLDREPNHPVQQHDIITKGPVIHDRQCNPMDEHIHRTILEARHPLICSFEGYFEHKETESGRNAEIKKFCKSVSKSLKNGNDKTAATISIPPILEFEDVKNKYVFKRELGAGAYAPVYLAERPYTEEEDARSLVGKSEFGISRQSLEAIKMEDPPSIWEFFILRTAYRRLGVTRAVDSIIRAFEMHLYKDECYLIEEYRDQGTLLDLVNVINDQNRASGGHPGMDEALAMFFTIEVLRTVEALHGKGIIHGDLKADNVLLRFDATSDDDSLLGEYSRDGAKGWSNKGISLIDFGRGIDMQAFVPSVQFIADWPTSATDCAEMRELRPWTYQADCHGVAAIAHVMLFGKYIETVVERGGSTGSIVSGASKTYHLKESLKRYWQTEIWNDFFTLMLNPGRYLESEEGQRLPVVHSMKAVRERMENHLETNGEKGVGLRSWTRKIENGMTNKRRG